MPHTHDATMHACLVSCTSSLHFITKLIASAVPASASATAAFLPCGRAHACTHLQFYPRPLADQIHVLFVAASIDKQLGTLEHALATADDSTTQFLAASLEHWGTGDAGEAGPSAAGPARQGLDALGLGTVQEEGEEQGAQQDMASSAQGAGSTEQHAHAGSTPACAGSSVQEGSPAAGLEAAGRANASLSVSETAQEGGTADGMDLFKSIAAQMGAGS